MSPLNFVRRGEGEPLLLLHSLVARSCTSEASSMARAYVRAPAYPRASALMRAGAIGAIDELPIPITLAWAEFDRIVRRPRPELISRRARQVELRGCGHVPTWDDPEQVAGVILEGARK